MRSLLKLVVLLFCVQRGEGHWLRSLLEQRGQASSPPSEEERRGGGESNKGNDNNKNTGGSGFGVEDQRGSVPSPAPIIPIRSRRSSTQCRLRSVLLQVRELGLGYDADETVLFKYCSGDCPRVRSNHDLTLTNLLLRGALPEQNGELWQNGPCCRPTHHEDLAFLDNAHRWHKVEKLSAAGCTCVG
ncbi:persephin-like [Salvelinus fontinalis]|uniref:persephin-like n=1 Tax=Salvelinus fontinalis TaxID=8038 RepID=UPI002486948B|nr:persephin-like [Salvelinus fontinalis]